MPAADSSQRVCSVLFPSCCCSDDLTVTRGSVIGGEEPVIFHFHQRFPASFTLLTICAEKILHSGAIEEPLSKNTSKHYSSNLPKIIIIIIKVFILATIKCDPGPQTIKGNVSREMYTSSES